ncbi:RagB/SusD family nutrient uptake outer membrane protein [Dysgonomonas sp. ZJ709]|uniref:RagB/SusD family nutrient uptake outer membrane protein n=1 Tax=Dysgonomonas sp. ZJ709 TaxID=2709797 RepID=UPI0013EDB4AD|nr:RagB/SusD family nutrient uptake outer membrane protein [Dysgonomonas sp. ZJ709]
MRKFLYTVIALAILGFSSCNDFLEEEMRSQKDGTKPFTSAADGRAAVNALYRQGFSGFWGAGSYTASRAMYDGYLSGLYENVSYAGMNTFITNALNLEVDSNVNDGDLTSYWSPLYVEISRRANYAIKNLPTCPGLTDAERSRLLAEAKFFRGLNYFFLVKRFGPVPLIDVQYTSLADDNFYPNRSSERKIYDFIIKDLTEALNDGGLANTAFPLNGMRVSKGTVLALLADVSLNMGGYPLQDKSMYAKAAEYADQLIKDPAYALIESTDKGENSVYNILRTSDVQSEYLYQIEFDGDISDAGPYSAWCFPAETHKVFGLKYDIVNDCLTPVPTFLNVYDKTDDLRYQDGQYFHTEFKNRLTGKVIPLSEGRVKKYPFFFFEETAAVVNTKNTKDRVVYRLAEMYLIYAEANTLATGNVSALAISRLAAIQARASISKSQSDIEAQLATLSPDAFVKEVWKERMRELIFENKTWMDVTRTRKYPLLDASATAATFQFVDVIGARNGRGRTFTEKDLLLPYPNSEIQRNPNLMAEPLN